MTEAEFLAQYMLPDDERKRLLIGNALLGLGSGLMQAKRGGELTNAGLGLFAGAQQGQNAIADAQRGQVDKFKLKQMWQEGEDKKAQQAAQAALSQRLTEAGNPTSGMPSLAPTNENAARIPKSYEVAMRQWQIATDAGDLKRAEEYRKAADFLREKYGLDPKIGIDPQTNQPYQFVLSESGTEKRLNAGAPPKFREVNRGGTVDIVNEYNLPTTGQSFAKTLTPEGVQSGKQWEADYGLRRNADQRAADAAKRANEVKPQWDSTSGSFVYPPSADAPQGKAVQPQGYQAKPPEHTRRELDSINAQLGTIEGARKAAEATPSAFGMTRGAATLGGSFTESLAGRMDSPDERNARSYVYNIVSAAINERAGAAQSVQELARLRSFLPGELDNAKQISDKLLAFEEYLKDKRKAYTGGAAAPSSNGWSARRVN